MNTKYIFCLFIIFILSIFLIGFLSGYIIGTEKEQIRITNFLKDKAIHNDSNFNISSQFQIGTSKYYYQLYRFNNTKYNPTYYDNE